MAASTTPRIRRTAQNTQFTYNLSRRISDVQTYPTPSPQGATILLYGHDSGVTVVWRGGKRFKAKQQPATQQQKKANGAAAADDSVMVIDSDDDEEPAAATGKQSKGGASSSNNTFVDKPEFEDEADDATPYPEIVQTLELTLGTAVLDVAVRPGHQDGGKGAGMLATHMVFAVSCVTNDVYLVTLPLTPPSPESKARPELKRDLLAGRAGSGAWGETVVLLGGQSRPSDGVALQVVHEAGDDVEGEDRRPTTSKPPRAVVASRSREASGVLRLWDVALDPATLAGPRGGRTQTVEPAQTEFLPSPLTGVSFNPNPSTTQVLAVSSPHGVRIYDYALPSLPPDPDATGPLPAQGSWLLTLYQPFVSRSSAAARKPVVDAAWIAHGRAVFALMADGMWGIWDVDGQQQSRTTTGRSTKLLRTGVRGAALTAFSASGYVEGTSSLRAVAAPSASAASQTGEFVPMTPHTRRQAAATITSSASAADRLASVHGGVAVLAGAGASSSAGALPDEHLALWIGDHEHVALIPGVARFWESQVAKAASGDSSAELFGAASGVRMLKLQDLSTGLLGERCCGVTLAPRQAAQATQAGATVPGVEVIIRGETRLLVVRPGEDGPGRKVGGVAARGRRLLAANGKSDAIIVHGKGRVPSASYNELSTTLRGTTSLRNPVRSGSPTGARAGAGAAGTGARPSVVGFDFTGTLDAAADVADDTARNVDSEMLDIMGIDRALESLGGQQAQRRPLFE